MAAPRLPLRRPAVMAAVAGLAAALAGCGSGPTVDVPGPVIRFRLDEFRIVPQQVRVPAGRLTLVARDTGVLTHDLQVLTTDRVGQPDSPIGRTAVLHHGETASLTLTLKPGTYALECTIANHADLGQTGTLIVTGRR